MSTVTTVGKLYLIDTSALARSKHESVRTVIAGLIVDRAAATCGTVNLEVGYSGRNHDEHTRTAERRRSLYVTLPMTQAVVERAEEVQSRMSSRGQLRAAGIVDLLTAAAAEQHGAVVLHYDADFEHIAAVTGQPQLWIAPRGSLN
ncbi:PIN domain nuclease [Kribbella antibiotica]|uniref:PIN domain nuclease n=1 Tax=Kribbella antibiotica TaxID=190195 RepID=UPI00192D55B1|nr:PIN domain nuclease [Kribbella antibiotica]